MKKGQITLISLIEEALVEDIIKILHKQLISSIQKNLVNSDSY